MKSKVICSCLGQRLQWRQRINIFENFGEKAGVGGSIFGESEHYKISLYARNLKPHAQPRERMHSKNNNKNDQPERLFSSMADLKSWGRFVNSVGGLELKKCFSTEPICKGRVFVFISLVQAFKKSLSKC